jgi:hypothetical protein
MRLTVVLIVMALVLMPMAAFAQPGGVNRGECKRMTRQIDRYENVVLKMAKQRGNKLWENATTDQISRMKNRRADRCPRYNEERTMLKRMKKQADDAARVMKAAAKAASKYFTGGWF